jgi:hypothetical protein
MSEVTPQQMAEEARTIGRPRGRPPKEVDEHIIYELARLMCTNKEIAGILRISHDTVECKYRDILEEGRSEARVGLRREQFRKAMEGNIQMLIWLGRQYLNQVETVVNKDDNEVLPWSDDEFTRRREEVLDATGREFDIVTFGNITTKEDSRANS